MKHHRRPVAKTPPAQSRARSNPPSADPATIEAPPPASHYDPEPQFVEAGQSEDDNHLPGAANSEQPLVVEAGEAEDASERLGSRTIMVQLRLEHAVSVPVNPLEPGCPSREAGQLDIKTLTYLVKRPPVLQLRSNDGHWAEEEQVLVGHVQATVDRRQTLLNYGIDLRFAEHALETGRWERCLFSEPVADLLRQLHSAGEFPFEFEAGFSDAEAKWRALRARGTSERPALPIWRYLVPATPETLEALAEALED